MAEFGPDHMGDTSFGRAALKKLAPVHPDFRILAAGWNDSWLSMRVIGAVFKRRPDGVLTDIALGGREAVTVTRAEIEAAK